MGAVRYHICGQQIAVNWAKQKWSTSDPRGCHWPRCWRLALVVGSVYVRAAWAAEHVMRLVTEDANGRFHFEPALVVAEPGDVCGSSRTARCTP